MRTWLTAGIVLLALARPALGSAQNGAAAPGAAPASSAVLEGDVSLVLGSGETRRLAASTVYLVPDSVTRSLAPLCVMRDSTRTQYVRMRRPIRLARDAARRSRGETRAAFLLQADSAGMAALAVLESVRRAEMQIIERVTAQRSVQTGAAAHYAFTDVPPGAYALYSDTDRGAFWFVPVQVVPGRQTRDLNNHNMTRELVDKPYMIAADVCAHAIERPSPAPARAGAEERQPVLVNRAAVQAELKRAYRSGLRGNSGAVTVRFRILADGSVDAETVEAIGSTVPEAAEPEAVAVAELIAEHMRFNPATIDGRPVAVWVTIPVTFD